MKKKKTVSITNPDDLNKNLQYTSPLTWIILSSVAIMLLGFFVWSSVFKMRIKISGEASIVSGEVTLNISEDDLNKLAIGQSFYIKGQEGKILSFNENGQPVVSSYDLADGSYEEIAYGKRPIEFLIGK